jgi:hypothetical protein
MDDVVPPQFLALAGFIGGLVLFARGLIAYRRDRLVSSVATSSLDAIAGGEVRVSGVVEALEQTLVSPLQSRPCVWYRARIESSGDSSRTLLDEERAVHFRIRDGQGHIRVVPRGARWEIETSFDEATDIAGTDPPALALRPGTAFAAASSRGRRYREARLEPGQTVTVIGQALPWADVQAAAQSDAANRAVDRDIAEDIAAARAAGILAGSPEEAWGNAAIPGFGIGRPTERPALDPDARTPELADPAAYDESMAPYEIPDGSLVLAKAPGSSMAVYLGTPAIATRQHDLAFLLGIVGAVMAVASALGMGALLTGTV